MANLLSPLKIKQLELINRIVLPPLATEKSTTSGQVTTELIEHYVNYAKTGVGLIITEHAYIAPEGKASPRQLSVADDSTVEGLARLASAIHAVGGIVGVQINHCGMAGKPEIVGKPVGPSPLRHPRREEGETAHELTSKEIEVLVHSFAKAASRVKEAGFDMVEIHSAHGYLISQFNSPLSNHRTDEYGGTLNNRFAFAREIINAVRKVVGEEFPIFFRLGADDLMDGGLTLEESQKMVPGLVEAGIDVLDLSGGMGGYRGDGEQGYFTYLSTGIKEVTDIPVINTGGFVEPKVANQVIMSNNADLIGVGRAMLKDHEWAAKAIAELS